MSKIKEFLSVELSNLKAEKEENQSNISRCEFNIESINDTIERLQSQIDSTRGVFKPLDEKDSDEQREILSLCEKKESIQKDIDIMKKRIVCIDNKIKALAEVESDEEPIDIGGYKMLSIRENERQRIARDIHDSVIQKMTALIHKTEFIQKVIDTDAPRAKLELEVINMVMHECVDELRDIIYDLRPMSLDDIGFKETIARYINQSNSITDMDIHLNTDGMSDEKINNIIAVSALRIIQELTSNSMKYSKGKNIDIAIYTENNCLVIDHRDDGSGYMQAANADENNVNTGFGLAIVRERVKMLNGEIKCEHEKGTHNMIRIPCLTAQTD